MEQGLSKQNTSEGLQKISQTVTVQLLKAKNFKAFSDTVPETVKECYRVGVPMVVVNQITPVRPQIEFELVKNASLLNIDQRLTIQSHQLPEISQMIYDDWKTLSLEDISLALRRLVRGHYGEIFRFDAAVITKALQSYSEELATLQEMGLQEQKKEYQEIDYPAFYKRLQEERNRLDEESKRKRESRIQELTARGQSSKYQTGPEELALKQLRIEWSLKYHYPELLPPNNKKPDWISFEEWLNLPE